ncbi:MAG: hypothetical protein FH758_14855 [Firmicutes bacterium]|nr:hypothetical protein [Bacillota bacterium]
MKPDIELILTHDGQEWIARNGDLAVSAESLSELDEKLEKTVGESGKFNKGHKVTVFMGFDYDVIPTWMRQYHTHYFNRLYTFEVC